MAITLNTCASLPLVLCAASGPQKIDICGTSAPQIVAFPLRNWQKPITKHIRWLIWCFRPSLPKHLRFAWDWGESESSRDTPALNLFSLSCWIFLLLFLLSQTPAVRLLNSNWWAENLAKSGDYWCQVYLMVTVLVSTRSCAAVRSLNFSVPFNYFLTPVLETPVFYVFFWLSPSLGEVISNQLKYLLKNK